MKKNIIINLFSLAAFIFLFVPFANAETGMCLVVCNSAGYDVDGDIIRIDLKDGVVATTTGKLGFGRSPRFSPDGNSFAYIQNTTVIISTVEGQEIKRFNVAAKGNLSFTSKGIYIGAIGKFYLYDLNGQKLWEQGFEYMNYAAGYVSQNGAIGGGVDNVGGSWSMIIYDINQGTATPVTDEQGCSVCPSPDGSMLTKNRGDHISMNIRSSSGDALQTLYVRDIIGRDPQNGYWGWNRQTFSGNSNDVIVLPIGQDDHWSDCVQLTVNCSPWIYNHRENKSYRLANRTGDWWQPIDYYQGKIPGASPDFSLSSSSLQYAAQAGGSNPATQPLILTASGGLSLAGLTISENAGWLTVSASGTGDTRTLSNNVNISGLASGTYNTTVTVSAGGITKTYAVTLTLSGPAPSFSLAPTTLSFSGQAGGSNPGAKTVTLTTTGNLSLADLAVTETANWLTVTVSGTGTTRTLTNQASIAGLSAATRSATVIVAAAGVQKTYTATLTLSAPGISITAKGDQKILDVRPGNSNWIVFLPEPGVFTLTAYDPQGRNLVNYASHPLLPGTHRIQDRRLQHAGFSTNGTYTVLLRFKNQQVAKNFFLIR